VEPFLQEQPRGGGAGAGVRAQGQRVGGPIEVTMQVC